jgi:glyoxylase-like metal-dependent hydrolase (beta-lactamase superfamily II)
MSQSMTRADLDKPAELTVWPGHTPARVADARRFSTLRAALAAAAEVLDAEDAKPWIITENGDILAPNWIRANTVARSLQ